MFCLFQILKGPNTFIFLMFLLKRTKKGPRWQSSVNSRKSLEIFWVHTFFIWSILGLKCTRPKLFGTEAYPALTHLPSVCELAFLWETILGKIFVTILRDWEEGWMKVADISCQNWYNFSGEVFKGPSQSSRRLQWANSKLTQELWETFF